MKNAKATNNFQGKINMSDFNNNVIRFAKSMEKVIAGLKSSNASKSGPEYQPYLNFLQRYSVQDFVKKIYYTKNLLFPLLNSGRKRILEVGSGYGLNLIILKFLGFEEVFGLEIIKSINDNANLLIDTAKEYLDFNLDNCCAIWGNAESTNFKNEEFEAIIGMEVVSHVPSFDRFMREMNRILVNKGLLVFSDGNNLSCPYYRRKRIKTWKKIRNKELEKRLIYLKKQFPDIAPQFRASIALHTELLALDEVKNIVPSIIMSNKLPMNLYFEGYAPVYAETGIWDEWGFYPKKLVTQLKLYGFSSEIEIYLGSARGFPFNVLETLINLLPNTIKLLLRPSFRCYAKKMEIPGYLVME